MNKVQKKMLVTGGTGAAILVLACGIYGIGYARQLSEAKEAAEELKYKESVVKSYADISYDNKNLGDIDLSGLKSEEIAEALRIESAVYQNRKVLVKVDEDEYTFSMKKLGEDIYYETSDGIRYNLGEEELIASYIVALDKDMDLQEQYEIISGNNEASECNISVKCKYNENKLKKFIEKLKKNYIKPMVNSHMEKNGDISKARKGSTLDIKVIKKQLKNYLNSDIRDDFETEYETTIIKPEWKKDDLKKVKEVISEFSTTFISTSSRGHNIIVGASRINGTCLLPGEKVSFDEVIHDSSDGQKFYAAGSYLNGKVVQTEGGGICQVSTTAYNALLKAGIIPVKRFPHSMPVHYVPLGLDAAISAGEKDLMIKNTLDVPILINGFTEGNTLTFQVVSYKDALNDFSYEPRSVQLSSLKAESYLDVYKNGKKKKTIYLNTDVYRAGA